ncbi:helix-turn-helix domain-containing protein [Methanolobus mangrovi]|uniref:Helix-turn-helix domain-containing protein n=1 Tax=Methanolobus mangrovi TaxID=3072977 RepID=A0AA51YGH4_9EURY|nr:helix-turn-helix domain-containing protein [Methanolobus mangrovi]WMW22051.1 helix-turn-helix domain-containing protein [Methanolobus mangrovi]
MDSELLEQVVNNLKEINSKLDRIIVQIECRDEQVCEKDRIIADSLDVITLLSLPDHLRTTATTLFEIGPATADEIANVTNKERAVESNYLNQLVRMNHVKKYRDGRKVYFRINDSLKKK